MSPHQLEFSARLSRIETGTGSSKSTLYVGADETYAVTYRQRGQKKGSPVSNGVRKIAYPLIAILAFAIGIASNVLARLADFMLNGLPDGTENVDLMLGLHFVAALMISSIIGVFFRFSISDFMVTRMIGIGAGMIGLHNVVHTHPQYFEPIFSAAWVNYIINSTEAATIIWRGASIVI
jgi:hypothetical protein